MPLNIKMTWEKDIVIIIIFTDLKVWQTANSQSQYTKKTILVYLQQEDK